MSIKRLATGFSLPAHLVLAALVALPLIVLGGLGGTRRAEAGSPPLNWTYRDRTHKFSMKMFRDYKAVPLKTDEKTVVAKFRDPKSKGSARDSFNVEIEVVRVSLDPEKDKPVTTGEGGKLTVEKLREIMSRGSAPKDIWEPTVGRLWLDDGAKKVLEKAKKKFKSIKSKDKEKIPGKLWQFLLPVQGSWDNEKLHVTMAEFIKDDMAYGIFMNCGEKMEKHYARDFKKIATSFKWADTKAKDVESLTVLDGVNITARKRQEIERSMVKGWDVLVSPQKNYVILYNTKNNKNHLLAKIIARRIEMIREQIYEVQFPSAKPITTVCLVRVCADRKEYFAYGGPGGSAGYWSSGDEELVFYDASASKKPDDDTLSVLYHEAFHQYIYYSVGNVAPHSWFNEGHGDYYAGAKLSGKKFIIKPFRWRVGTIKGAIVQGERTCTEVEDDKGNTRKQWSNSGYTPLKELVRFTQGQYYSYPSVCYAQGWSLIYFLREIVPKNKKYKAKWGHILKTYFDVLQREVNKDGKLVRGGEKKDGDEKKDGGDEKKDGDDEKKDGDTPKPDGPTPPKDGDGEGDEPDADEILDVARIFFRGAGGPEALKKAVDEAFKGVDWDELQKAWLSGTKRGR